MNEFKELRQWFQKEAIKCAKEAKRVHRAFTTLIWMGVVWLIIFMPVGVFFAFTGEHWWGKIAGLFIVGLAVHRIWDTCDCFKKRQHLYDRWMKNRQTCVDQIAELRKLEDEYKGYNEP